MEKQDEELLRSTLLQIEHAFVSARSKELWLTMPAAQELLHNSSKEVARLSSIRVRMQDAAALGHVDEMRRLVDVSPATDLAMRTQELYQDIEACAARLDKCLDEGSQRSWETESISFAELGLAIDAARKLPANSVDGKLLLRKAELTYALRRALSEESWEDVEQTIGRAAGLEMAAEFQDAADKIATRAAVIGCQRSLGRVWF